MYTLIRLGVTKTQKGLYFFQTVLPLTVGK